jgi:hypothetical protein
VTDAIFLVSAVLGAVTGCVTAYFAWLEKRHRDEEQRDTQILKSPGYSSNGARLPAVKRNRKIKMLWSLTAIAAAVSVGALLGWRVNQPSRVEIPATKAWTDTRVDCAAGSVFEIAATGTITHGSDGNAVGPDGNPDRKKRRANVKGLRDVNHAALIGSIDGQPPYFPVREKTTYTCHAVGRLFLGINDIDVDNNGGKFVARINERTIAG